MNDLKTYSFLLMIFISLNSFGQKKTRDINTGGYQLQSSTVDPELNFLYCSIGETPEFPGGEDSLESFALHNIIYPKSAIKDNVEGKVTLLFKVDTKGKVIDTKVYHGVRYDIDSVCLRMLRKMPKWKAAKLKGKPIAVQFQWPIIFELIDDSTKDNRTKTNR